MTAKKKVLKFFIVFILAVFLLSTGLISVLYLGGANNTSGTWDVLSWDTTTQTGIEITWTVVDAWVDTWILTTWTN